MNKLVKSNRILLMAGLLALLIIVYIVFLYKLQIIEGEAYYAKSSELITETSIVTAARGNIFDRYGRVLASNKECYNLEIDTTKLFDGDDPNATILELVEMVSRYGDVYNDDLPVTMEPPFEYTDMTALQKTMLNAYLKDKELPGDCTAVELMSYMRTRYSIDNSYSAEQMRVIAGVRYGINVRYAINTDDYIFVEDASMPLITSILESKLVGINVTRAYTRELNTEYAAHLLGYVGLMTQAEYEKYSLMDYSNNAYVGKDGVELAFEGSMVVQDENGEDKTVNLLHGQDGEVRLTKNQSGTILATEYIKEPVPGNHIYLTIDIVLQEQVERILDSGISILAQNRLQKKAERTAAGEWTFNDGYWEITGGACVVVDVDTGEPLAIASWPTYDPSNVIENFAELLEAENNPLYNRALQGTYAPGSSFKPCTAIAGLSAQMYEKLKGETEQRLVHQVSIGGNSFDTNTKVKCQGVFTKYAAAGYAPECWIWSYGFMHEELDVTHALLHSCNYFFYTVADQLGVDALEAYALDFGLGNPNGTGIELIEATGNMSNQRNHLELQGQGWRIGDTLQAGIGQSDSIFTPLQLAEYVATVAASGERHSASILKTVRSFDYSESLYTRSTETIPAKYVPAYVQSTLNKGPIAEDSPVYDSNGKTVYAKDYDWYAVHEGMRLVANDIVNNEAVAINFVDCAETVAAKTGTAQKGENIVNDAIFICYVPYDDPEIAIAMVVERGEAGSNCAFMARQIIDAYLTIRSYNDVSETEMTLLK